MNANDARGALLESVGVNVPFLCSLATVREDGGPAVRFVRAKADENMILRIPTFNGTQKTRQIRADGRVCITCGDIDSDRPGTYFQIEGDAEISTDPDEREACWTPRLERWFSGAEDEVYVVVRVAVTSILALPIGRSEGALVWRPNSS